MLRSCAVVCLAGAAAAAAASTTAGRRFYAPDEARGSLVSVSATVEGRPSALYRSRDGSGRFYLEARKGLSYALHLRNRSGERLGLAVTVDGLNVISGEMDTRDGGPGRLYVLDPWGRMTLRGWRRSLSEVHEFTFEDERHSYAARSGKANAKMGWIEVAVFHERARPPQTAQVAEPAPSEEDGLRMPVAPHSADREPASKAREKGDARESLAAACPGGHPGTGWGSRVGDRALLVVFEPARRPTETIVLRYEYRDALAALGVLTWPAPRDRLLEREQGLDGFAQPPDW